MRMYLIAAGAAALALAGCGNDDNLRARMVQCSGFIGGVGDTEMGGPIMETLGYNRIGSIGADRRALLPADGARAGRGGAQ